MKGRRAIVFAFVVCCRFLNGLSFENMFLYRRKRLVDGLRQRSHVQLVMRQEQAGSSQMAVA